MPTILTPQGWVKVSPPARPKRQVKADPKATLRGPLAYLSCQPSRSAAIAAGAAQMKGKDSFPYDLSASPEKLRRQGHANAGNRIVSAPVMHGALHHDEDYLDEGEVNVPATAARRAMKKSRTPRHLDDDNHSIASSSSSSTSSAPSQKSYTRHRPIPAPVEAQARPRQPSVAPAPAPREHYYSAPRYERYAQRPPMPPMSMPMMMPPSSASGRSMSYSWYNATTPLDLR